MKTRVRYSKEDKLNVALHYVMLNDVPKTSKATGVPSDTLYEWRMSKAWPELIQEAKVKLNENLDIALTCNIHKALEELQDRLHKGNYTRNGTRTPLQGKELAAIAALLYDKRAQLRGEALLLAGDVKVDFSDLKEQFASFARREKIVNAIQHT